MSISMLDFKSIVKKGGGLVISAKKFQALDLKTLASNSVASGAKITIRDPTVLTVLDMKSIAKKGEGNVIFDFSDV